MHSERLSEIAAWLPGALIALDFDGTLAPMVLDPSTSRPVAGVIDTLARLAATGAQVAIVTGRDAETVLDLGGLQAIPDVVVSGLHGAETWRYGQLRTQAEPAGIAVLRQRLPELLHEVAEGVWLEDKRLSLVVHVRRAPDPQRALAEIGSWLPELAAAEGLEVHPGKLVLEIRIPNVSKASAVHQLIEPETTAALFAGDDLGDLPAIEAVSQWGASTARPSLTIGVGELAELRSACDLSVESPAELAGLLATLARLA
jgi:trehalose 6-phosphate phosphatase